jgi:hypothetical protein
VPPQEEQIEASALPQSPQNFFATGLLVPQFEQTITPGGYAAINVAADIRTRLQLVRESVVDIRFALHP